MPEIIAVGTLVERGSVDQQGVTVMGIEVGDCHRNESDASLESELGAIVSSGKKDAWISAGV